ncbi:hypothetical protein Agabi119p4_8967 [Agaricus bisporus var. burnettii]|uniref:Reverse transcriptase Ty1/copia-type domain-containing protein n=1 Tax=Agaricus bisporus var. burnettii TaxID=192524 RepID=A0A8H7C483_AGABI|nr:hypothetical protein Agabi119p4_8967 [Agaricus bisporus var. burnettii]
MHVFETGFEETRPHYSTDPILTYPLDQTPNNSEPTAIAPRPQLISTLHHLPANTTPTSPTFSSDATKEEDTQGDSETEVSQLLGADEPTGETVVLRRSHREVKPSRKMRESLEYLNRTRANVVVASADYIDEEMRIPRTYIEAMRRPDLWYEPMVKELYAMKDKGVYRLVPRPQGKNVVRSRWVFAIKYDDAGNISTHKARLVAKGFTQVLGEDYDETYASVARLESVRMILLQPS